MTSTRVPSFLTHNSRWNIAARLAVTGSLIVAASVALTAGLVVAQVQVAMVGHATAQIEGNLRLARALLQVRTGGTALRLDAGRLVAANGYVVDGDEGLVDEVRNIIGGTATLFRGDLRVSTNVRKSDGFRAIGTRLAAGPV